MKPAALILLPLLALSVPAMAQKNLVQNGNFAEGPQTTSNGNILMNPGDTSLTGWSIGGNGVDYNTYYWQEPPGIPASIDLNGTHYPNAQGGISQIIATIPGALYQGGFYLSGNPTCDGPVKRMIAIAGQSMHAFVYDTATKNNTLQNMNWVRRTFTFTATNDSTTLVLASEMPGECGPVITGLYVGLSKPE
jgi:choice-of-anchor C domain-containing protein